MRERMRELDIRMSELARYTGVSRPTLYKYVESYDSKSYKDVPESFLRLFRYAERSRSITKEQVIIFAITEFSDSGDDAKDVIRKYIASKSRNDSKIRMMHLLVTTDLFDDVIPYLTACAEAYSKETMDREDIAQIARYMKFRKEVRENVPIKENEIEAVEKELEED